MKVAVGRERGGLPVEGPGPREVQDLVTVVLEGRVVDVARGVGGVVVVLGVPNRRDVEHRETLGDERRHVSGVGHARVQRGEERAGHGLLHVAEEVAGDGAVVRGGLEHERRAARAARLEVEDQVDVLVVGAVVAHLVAGADKADLLAVGDDDLQRVLRLAPLGLERPKRLDDGSHAVAVVGSPVGVPGDFAYHAVFVLLDRGRVVVGHECHGALGLPRYVDDDRLSRRVLDLRLQFCGERLEALLVLRVTEVE